MKLEALNLDFDHPDIAHAVRTLRALRHALEACGSAPAHRLVVAVARQYGVEPDDLARRLLAVLAAQHAARRWLTEHAQQVA